jgi:cardiolipin synthase
MAKKEYYKVRSKLTKDQIITIPNILSFFRLALIPVIVWLYVFMDSRIWTTVVILISSLTDIVDGFIARKFNMTSDFGKAIDPLADKLTQLAVLCCLLIDFPLIALPIVVMIVKEVGSFVLRLIVFKKTERVEHGEHIERRFLSAHTSDAAKDI